MAEPGLAASAPAACPMHREATPRNAGAGDAGSGAIDGSARGAVPGTSPAARLPARPDVRVIGLPIVLDHVAVERGSAHLLRDATLQVDAGVLTVVIGPNGAGKSTLLRVMHGLVDPTRGTLRWGDAPRAPAGQAMVFQRPVLLRRSAAANIDYALRCAGVARVARPARIAEALDAAGLGAQARQRARTLSGGEQQRLALARAWAPRPHVLFLDEPTASLDPPATRAVEAMVRAIHAQGVTIVMSTHNLAQARRLAQRVAFVDAGRLTEVTDRDAFFRAPRSPEAAAFLQAERA
jgi:tungstate transport system ATP-binding protein